MRIILWFLDGINLCIIFEMKFVGGKAYIIFQFFQFIDIASAAIAREEGKGLTKDFTCLLFGVANISI